MPGRGRGATNRQEGGGPAALEACTKMSEDVQSHTALMQDFSGVLHGQRTGGGAVAMLQQTTNILSSSCSLAIENALLHCNCFICNEI